MGKIESVTFEDADGKLSINQRSITTTFKSKNTGDEFNNAFRISPKTLKDLIHKGKEFFRIMPSYPNRRFVFDPDAKSAISLSIYETELKMTQTWANGRRSCITFDIGDIEMALLLFLE